MEQESGGPRTAADAISRPRMQTLSDLIFGLALSIGAFGLLSDRPTQFIGLVYSIVGFGWAFLILAMVWVRYTRVMSVLPVETGRMIAANMLLLFLVSVEPYLYNLIPGSFSSASGQLDPGTTSALYAVDMGSIFLVLAYFTHELAKEERRLIPKDLLRNYRLLRNGTLVVSAIFFISVLPLFWGLAIFGIQLRFILWMGTFVTWSVRRGLEARPNLPSTK